jgi:two-component system, NtrC family, sensor kinase
MKRSTIILILLLNTIIVKAQQETINNLMHELKVIKSDSEKFPILDSLAIYYFYFTTRQDSTFFFINETINNAFPLKDKRFLILGYARMGMYFVFTSQYKASLEISLKGIKLSRQYNIPNYLSALYYNIGSVYSFFGNSDLEMKNALDGMYYLKDYTDPFIDQRVNILTLIGNVYEEKKIFDSAFYYFSNSHLIALTSKDPTALDESLGYFGKYYFYSKNNAKADSICLEGIEHCENKRDFQWIEAFHLLLARSLIDQEKILKAVPLLHLTMTDAKSINDKNYTASSAKLLYNCFDKLGIRDSALYYLKLEDSINSEILSSDINNQIQETSFGQQLNEKEERASQILENEKNRNKITIYIFLTASGFLILIVSILWRNNRQKRKTNTLLKQQKEEIQNTFAELKSTQSQLIQSEKMASLGELTAGIAHEIQNPLNFVNNFSEVNKELIDEASQAIIAGRPNDAISVLSNLKENEERINHHGQRAEEIVKGMLQHSRASTGQKELTDINAVAGEYLRLAYHGLRAKDKSFNATMHTNFDPTIRTINLIPQDIGRVLLNLYNNAFYALSDKKKQLTEGFEPTIIVITKKLNSKVTITVKDNGNGISQKLLDKIFQPFFTTKPAGHGTGLGLSMSYDIIKAHGGQFQVHTKEGEYAEFVIELPE